MSDGYGRTGGVPGNIGAVGGPPGNSYLGLGPAGYYLGYELFGRKRDEEAQRRQQQELAALLQQLRPTTTQQATTTPQPTGRYQVGPEIGEPTTFPGGPPSLSNALTGALPWGTEPEGSYGPGIPPYLPEPQEFGPDREPFPIPQRPPAITGPWNLGASTYPGLVETRVQPPPEGYGISPWMAQGPQEVEAPPERPAPPPPGPAPVTGPRREPIPHIPVLGPETAPVTRMETVTKPGREILDVIAQNPQMLEVLKAFPGLLPLIQQEQENQAFLSAVRGGQTPAVGRAPSVATGTAAVGPSAATPTAEPVAPTTEALPEQGIYDKAHARRIEMQDQADRIEANPRAAASPMGKAYLARFEKAKDQEQKAADDLRAARKEQREAAKTETPTEFGVDLAAAKDDLRDKLGREPTAAELGKRVREIRAKEEKPAAPTEIGAAYAVAKEDLQKELGREPTEGEVGKRVLELRAKADKGQPLSPQVADFITDTYKKTGVGIDPRTGQPASSELVVQAQASTAGRYGRAVGVAGAAAGAQQQARQDVKLQEEIGVDAERFADPDGVKPKSNMTRGEVYKNYVQVDSRERAALQGGKQLDAVFAPKVIADLESLFPSPIAKVNQAFQTAVREGLLSVPGWLKINLPGMKTYSKEEIIKLQENLALYDRMDAVATMVARNYGETGNVATADTARVTKGWSGAATYPQFKAAIEYMRDIQQRGRDHMLATRRVRIPEIITVPGAGTFEEVTP